MDYICCELLNKKNFLLFKRKVVFTTECEINRCDTQRVGQIDTDPNVSATRTVHVVTLRLHVHHKRNTPHT